MRKLSSIPLLLGAASDVIIKRISDDPAFLLPEVLARLPIVGVLDHHA